jgi:hydrogenase maturation protein HypF
LSAGRHIEIRGVVQGVGFRPWVYNLARGVGLTGTVSNDSAGVVIDAFGDSEGTLDAFLVRLRAELPPAARIDLLTWASLDPTAPPLTFEIVPSTSAGAVQPSIPADLATCEACAREIADPRDRRYRYAFTSCTHCGPRFTIALGVPYDRATTTMAPFPMCDHCRREYEDPADRRFHAQPNACPACGPKLSLVDALAQPILGSGDAIARTAALLARGAIVAIKGLGGFHLACDATNADAVRELRRRKRREEKPFAIMVRGLRTAERLAVLGDAERRLLTGPAHSIVLAPRREGADVVRVVAPDGDRLGLMLPYTPLHHVLLGDAGRPLVMTSGNLSDEPIACDNEEALSRLADVADAFLIHDRDIASRADDSVAFVALGKPVPGKIPLPRPLPAPILACGAHLKNTFCIGRDGGAYFGPHIGDLDNVAAFEGYERAIERLEKFLRVRPEILAHDLHPDYLSTSYARRRDARTRVAVQHHHAHVASAMIEHRLEGPVLGVAFDGTGLGTDGTAWGGEILVADLAGFERVASLRPLRLAGGDRAIREVWRVALAALDDAFDGDPPLNRLPLFAAVPPGDVAVVRRMIATETNAPLASGAGRYFDAFGALGLARTGARFEGQVAMAWERAAASGPVRAYPYAIDARHAPWQIDLRPAVRAAALEVVAERSVGAISARFHATLVDATAEVLVEIARARGAMPVVLTGGCFQNTRLTEGLACALARAGFAIHVHGEVPPGDGGIALGQLAVAATQLEGGPSCVSASPEK